jgi:hypothetical protein
LGADPLVSRAESDHFIVSDVVARAHGATRRLAVEQPTKAPTHTVYSRQCVVPGIIAIVHDETHNAILAEVSSRTLTEAEIVQRVGA